MSKAVPMLEEFIETHTAAGEQTHINILAELYMQQGQYSNVMVIIRKAELLAADQDLPIDLQVSGALQGPGSRACGRYRGSARPCVQGVLFVIASRGSRVLGPTFCYVYLLYGAADYPHRPAKKCLRVAPIERAPCARVAQEISHVFEGVARVSSGFRYTACVQSPSATPGVHLSMRRSIALL